MDIEPGLSSREAPRARFCTVVLGSGCRSQLVTPRPANPRSCQGTSLASVSSLRSESCDARRPCCTASRFSCAKEPVKSQQLRFVWSCSFQEALGLQSMYAPGTAGATKRQLTLAERPRPAGRSWEFFGLELIGRACNTIVKLADDGGVQGEN